MKVELWYDPVRIETQVCVNGQWQEESDIYTFLYPVRQYTLQTWLNAAGTWPGLIQQMNDIARGEEIKLEFHGRDVDYIDLCSVVEKMDMLKLTFCLWDTLEVYFNKIEFVKKSIYEMKKELGSNTEIDISVALLKKEPEEKEWLVVIHSDQDLHKAEKDDRICCVVLSDVLDTYERLDQMERLTRSMRRPMDAICCCFQDAVLMDSFVRYATQFPRLKFRFHTEGCSSWREELWAKYGKANRTKKQLEVCNIISDQALIYLGKQKMINDNRRMELSNKKMRGEQSQAEEDEFDDCQKKSSQIRRWQVSWEKIKDQLNKSLAQEA